LNIKPNENINFATKTDGMRKLSMDELNRVSVEKFNDLDKIPLVCVLDNIRSQHNIGSIFRTSDAFRLSELFLCGITATPPNREINKSALGATESVKWRYFADVVAAIDELKSEGYTIIAIEQAVGSKTLQEFVPEKNSKIALVFGNEVNGVSDEVMQKVDVCLEIPQFGTKHSFNVSVTAGIVLYHFFNYLESNLNLK